MNQLAKILLFILLIPLNHSIGQNLVKNGDFEEFFFCPDNYTENNSKTFIPSWTMPTKGTPDYFNICSKRTVGVPNNFMGNIHAFDGVGYIGLVLLDTPNDVRKEINYREYVQTELIIPLQRNQLYLIKFYYAIADYSTFCINKLGIYLSPNKISERKGVLNFKPQIYFDTTAVYFKPSEWIEFADTFRAYGGETFLTLGNFFADSQTSYIYNDISSCTKTQQQAVLKNQIAYYYIDNFSVVKINENERISEFGFLQKFIPFSHYPLKILNRQIGIEQAYILDEVYFDVSINNTKPFSFFQTDSIVSYLKNNSEMNINLLGLWYINENDSTNAYSRAKLYSDQLVSKGIDPQRISFKTENIKPIPKQIKLFNSGIEKILNANVIAIRVYNMKCPSR